jgi:hypothetical protein
MNSDQTVTATFTGSGKPPAPTCALTPKSNRVLLPTHKKGKRANKSAGTLALQVKCGQSVSITFTGKLIELVGKKPKHGKQRAKSFRLGAVHASVTPAVATVLTVKLPVSALTGLAHSARESVTFTLIASNANGSDRATARIARLRIGH